MFRRKGEKIRIEKLRRLFMAAERELRALAARAKKTGQRGAEALFSQRADAAKPDERIWCSHCGKPTMKNRGPLFALATIDWWECTTCKMVERYRNNNDSRAQARSNAEDRGTAKEEATMSEGTLESLKQLREKQTKAEPKKRQPKATRETKATAEVKTEAPQQPTESAESKKMKTQKKEEKKQAPKTGERKAVKKVVAKVEREAKIENGKRTIKTSTNGVRTVLSDEQARVEIAKILKGEPEISPSGAINQFWLRKLSYAWPKFKVAFAEMKKGQKKGSRQ